MTMFACHWFYLLYLLVISATTIDVSKEFHTYDEVLLRTKFIYNMLESPPYITKIPVNQYEGMKHYRTCPSSMKNDEHNHMILYNDFITNMTILNVNTQDRNLTMLYYLPLHDFTCAFSSPNIPNSNLFWKGLDLIIADFAQKNNEKFITDNVFAASTYPWHVPSSLYLQPDLRYVLDIRFLRSDNQGTSNGRDIFVPYVVNRTVYNHLPGVPRNYSIFAACNEAIGKNDGTRSWRTKALNTLTKINLTDADIRKYFWPNSDFDLTMMNSDFCFIFPGDTASTSKLYKAIFAGEPEQSLYLCPLI